MISVPKQCFSCSKARPHLFYAWRHQANWKVWFSCKKKNVDGRNLTQCHSVMRPQRWPFNHLYFKQDGLFISKLGERFLGFRSKKSGNSTGKKHRNLEKFGFIFFCQFFNHQIFKIFQQNFQNHSKTLSSTLRVNLTQF